MREIKFRAWDKEEKEMYHDAEETYDYRCQGTGCFLKNFGSVLEDERFEIMQYTGLKDKNGKEIYEGDICKYYDVSDRDGVCIIESATAAFKANWIGGTISKVVFLNYIHDLISGEFEVIGNVWENSDLLKGE